MIQILTHRGLEPEKEDFFSESSYEAFADQAKRGFGLEFDVYFTDDQKIIISHNPELPSDHLCSIEEISELIIKSPAEINALHLKGKFQTKGYLDILLVVLKKHPLVVKKIFIFDVKIETAKYLKEKMTEIKLAPSVAHNYDIARYKKAVDRTLMTQEEALAHPELFDWVWLDEWDRTDKDAGDKILYTKEIFKKFHEAGIKIALVTPELHATSPHLLGGESHQDANSQERLQKRLIEISRLEPDAICTDYPELFRQLNQN